MNLCIIGTGYVGLVTGTCLAHIGHDVICSDTDTNKIKRLNQSIMPIFEPGLEEMVNENMKLGRLKFTDDISGAIQIADIIFIAVGTPQWDDGSANLNYITDVASTIGSSINSEKVIVVKSTVPVGTSKVIRNIISKSSNDSYHFTMVSNPEFLREGSAINDVFNSDRIIIGVENDKDENIMREMYKNIISPVFVTDIASAELIKYASNAFLATKISFVNEIANLCELVDADVVDVAYGMGLDKRIGKSFLNAGIGFGGSCFPKDVLALIKTGVDKGYDFNILNSVVEVNKLQRTYVIEKIMQNLKEDGIKTVAMWGLAFKPDTDDIRDSAAIFIAMELISRGIIVRAYDPIAIKKARENYLQIEYCDDVYETCKDANLLLVATEWTEYKNMDFDRVMDELKSPIIIDGRNILDAYKLKTLGFKYIGIGHR